MNPQAPTERRIRILPPHIINRIAAGEVVERPASVVKELVENALDAGATRIDIAVGAAGRTIRVADNGCGMTPDDAAMAFYNHATSKIRDEADLDRIATLGFRGEALASIGSIAKLTCLTRTADAASGTRVSVDERGEPALSEVGCGIGTVMEVADLFYNTPARLKFLKRPATELGHIEETVQHLALAHPQVRFLLTVNGKEALKTTGSGNLKQALEEVLDLKRENTRLVSVAAADAEAGLILDGFASEPGVMKSSKRWMMTYVNGRHVRCPILQKAIEAAYESLLPHGKYPLCVISLSLPPDELDVNVHPAKREVRYAAGNTIFSFVRTGLREALSGYSMIADIPEEEGAFSTTSGFTRSGTFPMPQGGNISGASQAPFKSRPVLGGSGGPSVRMSPVPQSETGVQAALAFYEPSAVNASVQAADGTDTAVQNSGRFKVIGQLFNTYILLETVQGLMVVDQHIASERAFFEALSLNLTSETPTVQCLITAQPIAVSPVQADLLKRHQADFGRLGFLYTLDESTGNRTMLQLSGYPLIYQGRDKMFESGGLFENLLAQLEETGEMKPDVDLLIATLSCHSAVRAGDPLEEFEMVQVIDRWLACRLPWTCPHGRPIAHTISKNELNKFFHRPSLPVSAL